MVRLWPDIPSITHLIHFKDGCRMANTFLIALSHGLPEGLLAGRCAVFG